MAIPDLTQKAKFNWTASCVVTGHLVAALWVCVEFRSRDHAQLLTNGRKEIRRQKSQEVEEYLSANVGRLSQTEILCLRRGKKMGACFSVVLSAVNRTELGD